jgi:phosphoglycolate phosphatase-like HAD superfamily hydrolase
VRAALAQAGVPALEAMMVGDTPCDIEAARAAGVDTIALRCGGWWDDAALAGAASLYDSPATLLRHWKETPIYRRRIPGG